MTLIDQQNAQQARLTCDGGGEQERCQDEGDEIIRLPGLHGCKLAASSVQRQLPWTLEAERGRKASGAGEMWGTCLSFPWVGHKGTCRRELSAIANRRACTVLVDKMMHCVYIVIYFVSLWAAYICESQWSPFCGNAVFFKQQNVD